MTPKGSLRSGIAQEKESEEREENNSDYDSEDLSKYIE
jgi:hypothetical protein